jgi:hypothetical protein
MATLSQLPDEVDLSFVAGDTFRVRVRVLNPNLEDAAVDLAGYGFLAEIAKLPERAVVAEFEVAPDPDNPDTAVVLSLSSDDTAVLPGMGSGQEFNGIWDLEVTFPPAPGQTVGDVRTVAKGTVTCVVDVSRK